MSYYDSIAAGYDELHMEEQQKKLALILKYLKPRGRLLDIGAGTGISTEPFLKSCDCYAIDPSEKMLAKCKAPHKFIASAESLPFPGKFFDVIISLTSLHLSDFKKSLAEIRRVSKPNAQIALTFLKKSKNRPKSLKGFKRIEEEKDIIFIKV